MPQPRRVIILISALVLGVGAVILKTTRAADDPVRATTAKPTAVTGAPRAVGAVTGDAPKPSTAKQPPPGAPQVPEESATIRDDPTIAPDPKQSADNNVSFPNDI